MKSGKLHLRKETLRMLTDADLTQAAGGTLTSIAYLTSLRDGCSGPLASWRCEIQASQATETD